MQIPTTTYCRIVTKKLLLKTFKKTKVPKYIKNQKQRANKGCAKIYRSLCDNNVLIIDDETYVSQDPNQMQHQDITEVYLKMMLLRTKVDSCWKIPKKIFNLASNW